MNITGAIQNQLNNVKKAASPTVKTNSGVVYGENKGNPYDSSASLGTAQLTQTGGTGTGSYGGSGASSSSDYGNLGYLDYLSAALAARQQAIANANAALDKQGAASEQSYKNQIDQAKQDYQKLRNQSELNKYKSLRSLRETQANRGLLNSGAGRQENLNVNATYGNALNEIGMQEQNEISRIQQAITQMWADIAARKAQNEAMVSGDMTSGLISALSNPLYQYGGVSEDAKALADQQMNISPSVANGLFASLTPVQAQALLEPSNQANWLNKLRNTYSNINY